MRSEKSVPTYESRPFAAIVEGRLGNHKLRILSPAYYRTTLNKYFRTGDLVSFVVSSKKPKRTEAQNRYYWVYLSQIAAETGNDPEELHELFKAEFLPSKAVDVLGKIVVLRGTTTRLTRTEFSEYIDKIAAMTGVEPPPVETVRGL